MEIKEIVEKLETLPNVFVDCNFGQGEDVLRKYFTKENLDVNQLDLYFANSNRYINDLEIMFYPREIPKDYLFFLRNYGGLTIANENSSLYMFGAGPLADVKYSQIVNANKVSLASGFKNIRIARGTILLSNQEKEVWREMREKDDKIPVIAKKNEPMNQSVLFFIDVEAIIQKDSIIYIKQIDIKVNKNKWKRVAVSFTEWINMLFEVRCDLNKISGLSDS